MPCSPSLDLLPVASTIVSQSMTDRHRFSCFTPISVLGPRLTLFLGTLGYALYVGALWWSVIFVIQRRLMRLIPSQFPDSRHSLVSYPRWGTPRNHCRALVVSSGCNNDELSPRKRQGQSFWHFLGTVPIWRLHWFRHSPCHQHQGRKLRCSINIDLYRECIIVADDEHCSPYCRHSWSSFLSVSCHLSSCCRQTVSCARTEPS